MRIEAHLVGTPAQRHNVIRATVGKLEELMYAMAEIGESYVTLTIDGCLHVPTPPPRVGINGGVAIPTPGDL